MKVVGFSFTKSHAERIALTPIKSPPEVDIQFLNLTKEPTSPFKEADVARMTFRFQVDYKDNHDAKKPITLGEVLLEGFILASISKDEFKELEKSWKKKQATDSTKIALFNLILRRCTPKAIQLEDEINLPIHIPFPRIQQNVKEK